MNINIVVPKSQSLISCLLAWLQWRRRQRRRRKKLILELCTNFALKVQDLGLGRRETKKASSSFSFRLRFYVLKIKGALFCNDV